MIDRRDFLKQTSILAAGALAGCQAMPAMKQNKVLSLQLYTIRNELNQDLSGSLQKVADIGYQQVETFNLIDGKFWGLTAVDFAKLLAEHELSTPAGHYSEASYFFENNVDAWKVAMDAANHLGQKYMVFAWFEEKYRQNVDDYRRLADKLNDAAIACQSEGLHLAYHNHDFEFFDFGGTCGFDILSAETDPALVYFELDHYWVAYAGKNSLDIIDRLPGRIKLWHIKDMDRTPNRGFTSVGSGLIDYRSIFKVKEKSGLESFFVEQDESTGSPFESIEKSFHYLNNADFI